MKKKLAVTSVCTVPTSRFWLKARINSGTVVVDAAGQHAGTLKVGAQAGSTGTLNVTSGWLEVTTEVVVGADPAATGVFNMSDGTLSVPTLNLGKDFDGAAAMAAIKDKVVAQGEVLGLYTQNPAKGAVIPK